MKHFLFCLLSFVALWAFVLCSCKTQRTLAPFVLRDSISITYKQGQEQPTPSLILCNPPKNLPNGGCAKSVESVESVRDIRIRVDTVFVERWHTQVLQPVGRSFSDSGPSESNANGLSAKRSQFYKNCTKGFWILLILFLGRIAFRIMKAIYLRK